MYAALDALYTTFTNSTQKKRFINEWRIYMEGNLLETDLLAKGYKHSDIDQFDKASSFDFFEFILS